MLSQEFLCEKPLSALPEESQTIESSLDNHGIRYIPAGQSKRSGRFFGSQAHGKGILFVFHIVLSGMDKTEMTGDKHR